MNAWARHITGAQLVHDPMIAPVLFGVFINSIGVDFERSSARTLFARFTPPTLDEQYKFGTLVFFNGFPTLVSLLMKKASIMHRDITELSTRLSKVTGESTLMVSVGCHYLSAASPTKGTRRTKTEL
jgi:hypothetical protein